MLVSFYILKKLLVLVLPNYWNSLEVPQIKT